MRDGMRYYMEVFILCFIMLQNRLHGGTLKYSIFLINLCGQPILIFFTSGVW